MNPLQHLLPAVYAALVGSTLSAPVYSPTVPTSENPALYVLLSQPTANRARGCRGSDSAWDCTVLIDCVSLQTPDAISNDAADEVAAQVVSLLDDTTLPLGGGFQMGQARAETITAGEDFDGEEADVHRYVRFRFAVYS